jgi:hypothetical protein
MKARTTPVFLAVIATVAAVTLLATPTSLLARPDVEPASRTPLEISLPALEGEPALARLREQGLYSSLKEAVRATRVAQHEANYPLLAQSVRLTADLGSEDDRFGEAVAISGNTAVVGAPGNDFGVDTGQGSVHVYTRSGTTWTLQQRLDVSDGAAGDSFGSAVAISGGTVVVGAPHRDVDANGDQGAAYVYTRSNDVWTLQDTLTADAGIAGDRFGYSVSVDGGTAIIGAPTGWKDNVATPPPVPARTVPFPRSGPGAAYFFVRSNGAWDQQQKVQASDHEMDDQFGVSVSLDGDAAVVGASRKDETGAEDAGAAYVFRLSGALWEEEQKLLPNHSATNNFFGCAVDMGGDTILIGSRGDDIDVNVDQGAAFIFGWTGAAWEQLQKLTSADGQAEDNFGVSVSLDGDVAVIGATEDYLNGEGQGSAYVFTRSIATWTELQRLFAARGTVNDEFGGSVAIDSDTVLVGAPLADVDEDDNQGSASVFMITQGFEEQDELTVTPGTSGSWFGFSVAISGERAVVGAYADNDYQGSAYVFKREGTAWALEEHLTAADAENGDSFGRSVAISSDWVIVGAYGDDIGSNDSQGSVYAFERTNDDWDFVEELWAPDGDAGDNFGYSVAISGDTFVVGAYHADIGSDVDVGSAYVFVNEGGDWEFHYQLESWNDFDHAYFGVSVAISVDMIVVGAYFDGSGPDDNHGTAQVFKRDGAEWDIETILSSDDNGPQDHFGISVAISGDTIVAGDSPEPVNGSPRQSSAYVFVRERAEVWPQQQKLQSDDDEAGDDFGYSVAISGDTIVVGAFFHDVGANDLQGSAFVYTRSGVEWTLRQEIIASDGADVGAFGRSVAISGDTVIVGANFTDVDGVGNQGAAFVFAAAGCPNITVDPQTLPDGTAGRSYDQSFTADGGDGPFNFSLASGALPPGLVLDPATGALSGTALMAGTYTFAIAATDGTLCPGSREYTLVIECQAITVRPGNPALPRGTVGVAYSRTFTAARGILPYSFSISAGAVPPGLTLDAVTGELSGTPTTAGTYSFEVLASDSGGCSGSNGYVLTVR